MEAASVYYITPTFAPDIERFALLRHSLNTFSPDIRHVAYVDNEDMGLFQRRFSADRNLQIVSKSEVIPPKFEAQRRFWHGWRGYVTDRIAWRTGLNLRRYSGWKLQQIVKIHAAACAATEAVVFLDSDMFLCGPVTASDYFAGTELRLLETPARSFEDYAFEVSCRILVGEHLGRPADGFLYIHQAPRFLRRTAIALLRHLEATHRDWVSRFFEQPFPSEYNLMGYTARVLEGYRGYQREVTPPDEWLYEVKEKQKLLDALQACARERGSRKFFLVQSNMRMPVAEYIPEARRLVDELGTRLAA